MKTKSSKRIVKSSFLLIPLIALLSGCASTPTEKDPMKAAIVPQEKWKYKTADAVLKEGDVKKHPPEVFQNSIDDTRVAALRALSFVGCNIERREDYYVTGKRPQKMGFFVGSGGETVKVFLYPVSTNTTHAWVDTDLSFVGIAGQQGWNKQVIGEMRNILNKPASPQ